MAELESVIAGRQVKCLSCGRRSLNKDNTYKTNSVYNISNRTILCKQCIRDIYDAYFKIYQNDRMAVYYSCRRLDFSFHEESYQSALTQYYQSKAKNSNLFSIYLSKLNSIGMRHNAGKNFDESEPSGFDEVNNIQVQEDINIANKYLTELIYSKKWVGKYTQADLDYLGKYLDGLKKDNNIISTNHEDYAKQICKSSLLLQKEYNEDKPSGANIAKLTKVFDDLCNSAKFSEKSKNINAQVDNLSTIIESVENGTWIDKLKDDDVLYNKDIFELLLDQTSNIERSIDGEAFDIFKRDSDEEENGDMLDG